MTNIKRLNYSTGQFLTAPDFQLEQDYHKKLRRMHNQGLHTPGVASGLTVSDNKDGKNVSIANGFAIDGLGNEMVLQDASTLIDVVTGQAPNAVLCLSLAYSEAPPDPADKVTIGGADVYTRTTEKPVLALQVCTAQANGSYQIPSLGNAVELAMIYLNAGAIAQIVAPTAMAAARVPDPLAIGNLHVTAAATVDGTLATSGFTTRSFGLSPDGQHTLFLDYNGLGGRIYTGNNDPLFLQEYGGPVGIGNTAPAGRLHIGSPALPNPEIYLSGATTQDQDGLRVHYNNSLRTGVVDVKGATLMLRGESGPTGEGGTARLIINLANGFVGVGPNVPIAPFHAQNGARIDQSLYVSGPAQFDGHLQVNGGKNAYVMDQFVNRLGDALEAGDVVVIGDAPIAFYYGVNQSIPVPEVDLARSANDTRVCGVVCEVYGKLGDAPSAYSAEQKAGRDHRKVGPGEIGYMVTLGAYAFCKVDADIASIAAGDLLTSSATPGHAQKVLDRARAVGAIVGKALAPLKKGKGKIPVMVMLQ